MKTKNFLTGITISLSLGFFCPNGANAQQPNQSLSDQMDYLVAPLDFTEVTSGLLLDRGFKMMNVEDFDGTSTADTLIQYGDWFRQFGTMVTSKTGVTSPIGVTADYKPTADAMLETGVIPIMVLHTEYHKFIADSALLTTLITIQNDQLHDVPERTTSPYEMHEIFSFSPKKNRMVDELNHDFRINSGFIRSNTAKTIASVEIDFDNGSGYQSISLNTNKKITWSTFGKKYLKLKITYTDSSIYHAISMLDLVDSSGGQPKYNSIPDEEKYIAHPTIANHGATISIAHGCGNDELRKPFIYVEGFNPEQWGNQTYYSGFYDKLRDYEMEEWPTGFPLLSELEENGYDVVYVDFDRGSGNLIENAKTVQEVIRWVNEEKAANSSSAPNIIAGYSMGGVVVRLALTYMEAEYAVSENPDDFHGVSYYVSVDAPHLGANVPRGVIAALLDIYNYEYAGFGIGHDIPNVEEAYQVLFSPAARQMLIYSGEGSNDLVTGSGPTHIAFQTHLAAQRMPTQTLQNIAVSKGNGNGVGQGYGSLTPLLNVNTNTFNVIGCYTNIPDVVGWLAGAVAFLKLGIYADLEIDINTMAGYSPNSYHIYYRRIRAIVKWWWPFVWDKHETKAKYVRYYDGTQGGHYDVSSFAGLDEEDEEFIEDLHNGAFQPCAKLHQTQFCFIPTVSALNIQNLITTPGYQIDTQQIVDNGDTPFDKAFVLDPSKYPVGYTAPHNESHLDLTPSNVFPFSKVISPDFNAVNENPTVHGYTFNFGYAEVGNEITETTDQISHPLTVSGISSANGALWINRADNLANINDNNNPISTSNQFTVDLKGDCSGNYGRVTVESLGSIVIGEDDTKTANVVVRDNSWIKMNDGFIEVRDGSKLIIEAGGELRLNGGVLRVEDGGEVIIKSGGKLIYEAGAQIELNGNDAVLSLGGLTHIGDDATFTFTWQGTESGYIRMLKEGYWGERFSAGLNADVKLQGENKDDLIMYMEENVNFWEFAPTSPIPGENYISQKFDQVIFKDGKIIMEDDARIVLLNKSWFTRTTVESLDASHHPRGITPLTVCYISSSTLNRMPVVAELYYSGAGTLYIGSSTLNNSVVRVKGYGYYLQNCLFDNNSSITSMNTSMGNSIFRTTFINAEVAVYDDSGYELFVSQSNFYNNEEGIIKKGGELQQNALSLKIMELLLPESIPK